MAIFQQYMLWQYLAIWPNMVKYGHNLCFPKYGHDEYPRKEHKKINSAVRELSDCNVWSKSYDPKNIFGFLE